jgi:two-component system invasion response regulator UvrY
MIRVFIADDHPLTRKGIKQTLDDAGDILVCGEAGTGREVMNAVMQIDFDVLVLDVVMPDGGGFEVLDQLKSYSLDFYTIVLSMYPEEQYALRALKAGASGYLTKDKVPEELIVAIRKVVTGGKFITSSLAERLAFEISGEKSEDPHEILSNREFQVMYLIASGRTLTEIANELSLSIKTISTYRTRILKKLGLRNTTEIIRYAFKNKIVE